MTQLQVQANISSSLKQMLCSVSFSNFGLCRKELGPTEVQCLYKPPLPWLYIAQPQSLSLSTEEKKSGASEHIHIYKARSEATSFLL